MFFNIKTYISQFLNKPKRKAQNNLNCNKKNAFQNGT